MQCRGCRSCWALQKPWRNTQRNRRTIKKVASGHAWAGIIRWHTPPPSLSFSLPSTAQSHKHTHCCVSAEPVVEHRWRESDPPPHSVPHPVLTSLPTAYFCYCMTSAAATRQLPGNASPRTPAKWLAIQSVRKDGSIAIPVQISVSFLTYLWYQTANLLPIEIHRILNMRPHVILSAVPVVFLVVCLHFQSLPVANVSLISSVSHITNTYFGYFVY